MGRRNRWVLLLSSLRSDCASFWLRVWSRSVWKERAFDEWMECESRYISIVNTGIISLQSQDPALQQRTGRYRCPTRRIPYKRQRTYKAERPCQTFRVGSSQGSIAFIKLAPDPGFPIHMCCDTVFDAGALKGMSRISEITRLRVACPRAFCEPTTSKLRYLLGGNWIIRF